MGLHWDAELHPAGTKVPKRSTIYGRGNSIVPQHFIVTTNTWDCTGMRSHNSGIKKPRMNFTGISLQSVATQYFNKNRIILYKILLHFFIVRSRIHTSVKEDNTQTNTECTNLLMKFHPIVAHGTAPECRTSLARH